MDDKFYTEVLESNKSAVRKAVTDAMMDGIKRKFEWELPATVNKEVSRFVEEEIVPAIRADLLAQKDEIISAATAMIKGVPEEIAKAMQERLAVSLKDSWKLRKVTEALFQ